MPSDSGGRFRYVTIGMPSDRVDFIVLEFISGSGEHAAGLQCKGCRRGCCHAHP